VRPRHPFAVTRDEYDGLARALQEVVSGRERLRAERDRLRCACRRLLDAYEAEESEHGFPLNFELRAAHRALAALLDDEKGGDR
jgi:hypothetical protein